MRNQTFYEILEVKRTASQKEIREKYLILVKAFHPDLCRNGTEITKSLNLAYWTLKDKNRRREYDLTLQFDCSLDKIDAKDNCEPTDKVYVILFGAIHFLNQKRVKATILVIFIFLICFYDEAFNMNTAGKRDIIFNASLFLYFLSLMGVMRML